MAYIGLKPVTQTLATASQLLSGDGSTRQFTLQQAVSKASDIFVSVDGAVQVPVTDYTANGTTLLFATGNAPSSNTDNISITFNAGALNTVYITANAYPVGTTVEPSIYATGAATTGIYWPATNALGLTVSGNTRVTVSDAAAGVASSTTTGALRVAGGAGITGALYTGGTMYAQSGTNSTNTTTGALIVSGGIGATGAMYLGGSMTIAGALTVAGAFTSTATNSLTINTPFLFVANTNVGDAVDQGFVGTYNDGIQRYTGLYRAQSDGRYKLFTNLDNQPTTLVDSGNVSFRYADLWLGNANVTSVTSSTTSQTGALTVWGGVGVRGSMYINQLNNAIAIGNGGSTGVGNIGASGSTFNGIFARQTTLTDTIVINSNNNATAVVNGGTSGVGNIGGSGATFNTIFAKATTAQYADLAERYFADAPYEPGTVLEFGGVWDVTESTVDMSTRIAGVVSTNPAFLMNEGLTRTEDTQHIIDLALTGRVPCKVQGSVTKGDMLVSAGNGRARAEADPKLGSVLGKALENFAGEQGIIEIVVGRL